MFLFITKLGWTTQIFDTYTLNCMFNKKTLSYVSFLVLLGVFIPFCFIVYFYSQILIKIRSVHSNSLLANSADQMKKIKGLICSCVIFLVCYAPYCIVVLTDINSAYPKEAHMYTMALLHANSSLNPILYFFTNTPIRDGYINLFNLIFRRNFYRYK